jgi:hypothetical protein
VVADPDAVPKSMSTPEGRPETDEAAVKRFPDRARAHAGVLAATNHYQGLVPSLSYPEENAQLPNFPDLPPRAANMMQGPRCLLDERSGDWRGDYA